MAQLNYNNPSSFAPNAPTNFMEGFMWPQREAEYQRAFGNSMSLQDLDLARQQYQFNEYSSPQFVGTRLLQNELQGQQAAGQLAQLPFQTNEAIVGSKLNTQNLTNQLTQSLFNAGTQQTDMEANHFHERMLKAMPLLRNFVDTQKAAGTPVDFNNPQTQQAAVQLLRMSGVPLENIEDAQGNLKPGVGQVLGSIAMADPTTYEAMMKLQMERERDAARQEQARIMASRAGRGMTKAEDWADLREKVLPIYAKMNNNIPPTPEEKAIVQAYEQEVRAASLQASFQANMPGAQLKSALDAVKNPNAPSPIQPAPSQQQAIPEGAEQPPPGTAYHGADGKPDPNQEILYRLPSEKGGWKISIRNKQTGKIRVIETDAKGNER